MKARMTALTMLALALATGACTKLLNASIPNDGYQHIRDIAYGDHPRQLLDIYVPDATDGPAGVLVFFHGGSWQSGSKDDYRFFGEAFATRGYVVVIANYRLYPEVYFPTFVDDGAKAVVWVHRNIAQYKGNASRLFVSGHSAGAHIALMLALNDAHIRNAGGEPGWIRATLGIAGPYDFLPMTDPDIIALFSKVEEAKTQPITYADRPVAPVFLATGDADGTVLPRNSYRLADALRAQGSAVELKTYPGVAHIGIILSLAYRFRDKAPLRDDMVAFMDRYR